MESWGGAEVSNIEEGGKSGPYETGHNLLTPKKRIGDKTGEVRTPSCKKKEKGKDRPSRNLKNKCEEANLERRSNGGYCCNNRRGAERWGQKRFQKIKLRNKSKASQQWTNQS